MKINFVIPNNNKGWAYPLIKWKKEFKKKGINIEIVSSLSHNPSKVADVTFLTSRYYNARYKSNDIYFKKF